MGGEVVISMTANRAEALVKTLSVGLRVIHVGKQKMTLSTFKQIPELPFDRYNEFRGMSIGWVSSAAYANPTSANPHHWMLINDDGILYKMPLIYKCPDPKRQIYVAT